VKWWGAACCLAILLPGCVDLEKACTQACDRPFQLAQKRGEAREKGWAQMPDDLRHNTPAITAAWKRELEQSRNDYLGQCASSCQEYATKAETECRRRAGNMGEWKRCGK
jgi:hypothetical protein